MVRPLRSPTAEQDGPEGEGAIDPERRNAEVLAGIDTGNLVWHYTDAAGLLSIVRHHVLWATASGFLNDLQEIELGKRRLRAALDGRAREKSAVAALLQEHLERSVGASSGPSQGTFFILSAAEHWDLLAMWRCYGGGAESYAIGLDSTQALPVLADPGAVAPAVPNGVLRTRSWTPVAYSAQAQRELATRTVDMLPEAIALAQRARDAAVDSEVVLDGLGDALDELEQALVLVKHAGFGDEREVRHTVSLLHRDHEYGWGGIVRYRASRYGVAPYLWLTGATSGCSELTQVAAPLPIRAVAISPSPNGPVATESLRAMLRSEGYDVPVLRSEVPFR